MIPAVPDTLPPCLPGVHQVLVASDHRGAGLAQALLDKAGTDTRMMCEAGGLPGEDPADYPLQADRLAGMMARHPGVVGVLVCGTGIGMSMAANRHHHIRAALCRSEDDVVMARRHNNANVLVLGAGVPWETAVTWLDLFMATPFEGGRHRKRLEMFSS